MISWLRSLFSRGPVIGWRVRGADGTDYGEFLGCDLEEVFERVNHAQMLVMLRSASPEVYCLDLEAAPVRKP